MTSVRWWPALGLSVEVAVLGALAATVGLGPVGWAVGLLVGAAATGWLARGLRGEGLPGPGPADLVTLGRALLVGGVAALVADGVLTPVRTDALVLLAGIALLLDAVDGQVARRTRTATPHGARFDMEVDAFLILVLSIQAARLFGPWVLVIGIARYLLWAAEFAFPWLRRPVPPRYWRKVVAAVQGVVLTASISDLLPDGVAGLLLVVAAVLLGESFGRDVVGLFRSHRDRDRRTRPRAWQPVLTVLAVVVLWAALALPGQSWPIGPAALLRLPVEGLVLVGVCLVLPVRPRRIMAGAVAVLLGVLVLFTVLDIAYLQQIGRPFNPVIDVSSIGPAIGVLGDSIGGVGADLVVAAAVLLVVGLMAAIRWSLVRLATVGSRRTGRSGALLGGVAVLALVGVGMSGSLVTWNAVSLAVGEVRTAGDTLGDRDDFLAQIGAADTAAFLPASHLLTGLRGKDVLIVFVESYGQVAVQNTTFSPAIDDVLRSGTDDLTTAGYSIRSAFLDSPTFGGISWLAHSTLQSGLWVDNQQRYDQLVASSRFTLSDAFGKAGWRTVSDIPSDDQDWPQGRSFYHYDQLYDQRNVGYAGPKFSYAAVPDQFTLNVFRQRELQPGHRPVMAEIDLVSSHTPWTPLPSMVGWDQLGDGTIYGAMSADGPKPSEVWKTAAGVQASYGLSIQYSLQAMVSWLTTFDDPNLVVVMLGDHQPAAVVSGNDANHEVPISIIAQDPAVLDSISSWNWQDGLLPTPSAPVWPMDSFRNRFLDAYSFLDGSPLALKAPH